MNRLECMMCNSQKKKSVKIYDIKKFTRSHHPQDHMSRDRLPTDMPAHCAENYKVVPSTNVQPCWSKLFGDVAAFESPLLVYVTPYLYSCRLIQEAQWSYKLNTGRIIE